MSQSKYWLRNIFFVASRCFELRSNYFCVPYMKKRSGESSYLAFGKSQRSQLRSVASQKFIFLYYKLIPFQYKNVAFNTKRIS